MFWDVKKHKIIRRVFCGHNPVLQNSKQYVFLYCAIL